MVVEKGVNLKQFVMIVGRWLIYGRMSSLIKHSSNAFTLETLSQSTNFMVAYLQVCYYLHHTNICTDAGTDSTERQTLSAYFGTELLLCELLFYTLSFKKKYITYVKQCVLSFTQESCLFLLHLH